MKFTATITRYIRTVEVLDVEVEAESPEDAREKVETAYCEGDYEGAPYQWSEDLDSWDAYEHEIEITPAG